MLTTAPLPFGSPVGGGGEATVGGVLVGIIAGGGCIPIGVAMTGGLAGGVATLPAADPGAGGAVGLVGVTLAAGEVVALAPATAAPELGVVGVGVTTARSPESSRGADSAAHAVSPTMHK